MTIQLKCPSDYSEWLQSMYSQFGTKWCKLHRGPGWSYEATEQGARPAAEGLDPLSVSYISLSYSAHIVLLGNYHLCTNQARVNVPAPSDRTIQRAIASCDFEVTADIQV